MKLVCDACGTMAPPGAFRVEGRTLVLGCAACGGESRVEAPVPAAAAAPAPGLGAGLVSSKAASNVVALRTPGAAAVAQALAEADQAPFRVPEGVCPRCVAPRREGAEACASCGAVFAQLGPEALAPPEVLGAAWRELLRAWGDGAQHEAAQRLAHQHGELAALGRLYRLRLAAAPDDPWAQRGRDAVLRLALQPVAARSPPEAPAERWKPWLAGAVGVATLAALVAFLRMLWQSSGAS